MDLTLFQTNYIIFGTLFFLIFYSVYFIQFYKGSSMIWDIVFTTISFIFIIGISTIVANLSLDF